MPRTERSMSGRHSVQLLLLTPPDRVLLAEAVSLLQVPLGADISITGDTECSVPWDIGREQRRADLVVAECVAPHRAHGIVVGLLGDDLFVPGLNFVFGLADPPRKAAVVSWARLLSPDPSTSALRLAKEVVHEVGHLWGLGHCSESTCVMHFSNSLAETDAKGLGFCHRCGMRVGAAAPNR